MIKKRKYIPPEMEIKEFAQFENVFTYCTKGNEKKGCIDITGSGNDADKGKTPPSQSAAFSGNGGSGV